MVKHFWFYAHFFISTQLFTCGVINCSTRAVIQQPVTTEALLNWMLEQAFLYSKTSFEDFGKGICSFRNLADLLLFGTKTGLCINTFKMCPKSTISPDSKGASKSGKRNNSTRRLASG